MNRCLIKIFMLVLMVSSLSVSRAGTLESASGDDLNGVFQSFNTWLDGDIYYLYDPSFSVWDISEDPFDVEGIEPLGDTVVYDAQQGDGKTLYNITSANADSGWDDSAVSAINNIYLVDQYFRNIHGRNGLDDNEMNYLTIVHFDEAPDEDDPTLKDVNRTFWNGHFMVYSDGGNGSEFNSFAGCLDVAAHEMSHAVIEYSANFKYKNQSGALKEAFADIFAAMIDDANWTIGEACAITQGVVLRSLDAPNIGEQAQAYHMDNYDNKPIDDDFGGVHVNSGIPSRAAYLLAEGLSAEGTGTSIGRVKTEQIFYLALTDYLDSTATFIDARIATLLAAEALVANSLYGMTSADVSSVETAWDEVGVVDAAASPQATNGDIVSGDDELLYLKAVSGGYSLYKQGLESPFVDYDVATDLALGHAELSANSRPVLVTFENDFLDASFQYVYYVGVDEKIYRMDLDTNITSELMATDKIKNMTVSPDNKRLAFVTIDNLNTLSVMVPGAEIDTAISYSLLRDDLIDVAEVGALAFDFSGRNIVFNVAYCQSLPDSLCKDAGGYRYQSLAVLNLDTNHIEYPLPNQPINIEIGFPSFAYNNSYMLVMDRVDKTVQGSITSEIVTFNMVTQEMQTLVSLTSAAENWGVPSFWGDDNYVTYHNGGAAYRVPVNTDGSLAGAASLLNPDALMPIMHRRGVRDVVPLLSSSVAILDFGEVLLDDSKELELLITNNGSVDIEIKSIISSNDAFSHNGVNTFLPRNESISLTVRYQAGTILGNMGGNLLVSYGDGDLLDITMSVLVASAALLTSDVDVVEFGNTIFNETGQATFGIENHGTQKVKVSSYTLSNPVFSYHGGLLLLGSAGNNDGKNRVDIVMGYDAGSEVVSEQGTLTLFYNDGKSLSVAMAARTIPIPTPALLEPALSALDFGQVEAWSVTSLSVVLNNVGEVAAIISTYGLSNEDFFSSLSSEIEGLPDDLLEWVNGEGAVTVHVSYAADDVPGLKTTSLEIAYSEGKTLSIPVSVEVLAPEVKEEGRGGFASLSFFPLFAMLLVLLVRYRRTV